MKKIVFWLIVIFVVGCHEPEEPVNPVETVNRVADIVGTYQAIRIFDCFQSPYPLNGCERSVRDSVLVVEQSSDSTFRLLGRHEAHVDKEGKISCCVGWDPYVTVPITIMFQNDTLWITRPVRRAHTIYDVETYVGVKDAESRLKAGTVGFRSSTTELSESSNNPILIDLDITDAKLGAAIIIEILNTSTATSPPHYTVYGGDAKVLYDNKLVVYVMANTTSTTVGLNLSSDYTLNPARTIQFRISDESVGITPSENKNHTLTILDDDVYEPSINKIIFTQNNSPSDSWVYDINSDGSLLRNRFDFTGSHWPTFSPDGNRVVFVSEREEGTGEIYTVNFMGDDLKRVTSNNRKEIYASYSPAGDKVLFVALVQESPMNWQIFSMDVNGSAETQLSHIDNGTKPLEIKNASWSPDGTQIIFTSNLGNEGVGYRNYIMNADGSNVRRLSDQFRSEGHPRFSPDAQKIIFNVGAENEESLYLMNADGTGEEKLFSGIAGLIARNAEWSPDGQTIIFQGRIDLPDFATFTSRIDGSDFGLMMMLRMDHASWSPAK